MACENPSVWTGSDAQCEDFGRRWTAARSTAVRNALALPHLDEDQALRRLPDLDDKIWDQVLRHLFDNSRRLGLSMRGHFGRAFAQSEIMHLLRRSGIACFGGGGPATVRLDDDGRTVRLSRGGCAPFRQASTSRLCDYWREAADGLVMGLGDAARYTRHASLGAGDGGCVDLIFDAADQNRRLAEVPAAIRSALAPVITAYAGNLVEIVLEGVAEQTLYYRLETRFAGGCGAGTDLVTTAFGSRVARMFPGLTAVEIAAAAVMS